MWGKLSVFAVPVAALAFRMAADYQPSGFPESEGEWAWLWFLVFWGSLWLG